VKAYVLGACVCALVPLAVQVSQAQQGGDDVRNIGSRLELFVDDYLIESMTNVTQTLHSPQRRETVLTFDKPWEGAVSSFPVVFQDGDIYRLYYYGMEWGVPSKICYAESRDGINWTRPNLGICEFQGSKDNNIIITDPPMEQFAPFKGHKSRGAGGATLQGHRLLAAHRLLLAGRHPLEQDAGGAGPHQGRLRLPQPGVLGCGA
jgi:hypothetical protein